MTFFADLTTYEYMDHSVRPNTVNIGWLERGRTHETGNVPEGFLRRLLLFCKTPVIQTRGFHVCEYCLASGGDGMVTIAGDGDDDELHLGSAEIRVFGKGGTIFAAPDMIYHYAQIHQYRPPIDFVDAVLTNPGPENPDYFEKLFSLELLERDFYTFQRMEAERRKKMKQPKK